ncbi:MAG: hypothetical protein IIA62_09305 [Nitrospinae bacterium]|nr:hypothetical protein [Nitrospinota bacterium]
MYSFFPLQFEMLFLFCMTFGWEALPQLAGLGMTLILLGAMTLFFKRRFSTRYLAFVPALFFCVPTFFDISTIAYIDAAVGGFTFLCFYCWERWAQTKQEAWFWLMCLFAASAWGVKLTAFIVLPLVVLGIALAGRHRPDPAWVLKKILIFSGIVLVFILPWWLRNYHYSGNPFAPLFMQVFGGEEKINWDPQRAFLMDRYVRMFGMGRGWLDFLLLPVNLTFFSKINSLKFDGQIGIVYFMLLPCLIWTWKNRNTLINSLFITFGVLLVFWFIYFQYIRFLAISFPFFTLLCVYGLEAMTRPAPDEEHSSALSGSPDRVSAWQKGFLALVAGGVLFNLSLIAKDWNRKAPLDFLAGLESRDQYLTRHLRIYPMYKTMNQKLPQDAKVLFVYMRNFGYLAEREFISDSIYEDHTLKEIMRIDKSVEGMLRQFKIRGITHLMYNNKFVFGKDSAFLPYETAMLKSFIDTHGKLAVNKNEFYLYSFMLD